MPSIRKLVEHLINLFMIALILSVIGEMFNNFFDIESNKTILIAFIFVTTIFIIVFYSQISEKNNVAKYIARKLVKNPDRKLTIKDIIIVVLTVNIIAAITAILL